MSIETFTERRARIINQPRSSKSASITASEGTTFLPLLPPSRAKPKPIWKWPVVIMCALLSAKVVLWHGMGEANYSKLVQTLSHGSSTQAALALVMTPDPATAFVVSALDSLEDSPRIFAIGDVHASVSFVDVKH